MMYVICFYWEGDRWNTRFDPENSPYSQRQVEGFDKVPLALASRYVNNLYRGVNRNATRPFKFICFTNSKLKTNPAIEVRSFPLYTKMGVLPRIWMFSEEAGLGNSQVLCLDLDLVIMNPLKQIMAYDGKFCTRASFRPGDEYMIDGDIMSFRAGEETDALFWKPFIADLDAAETLCKGRERYWIRHVATGYAELWHNVAPWAILSYKQHVMRRKMDPSKAEVVSFHGNPKPHRVRDPIIKNKWSGFKS